MSSTNFNQLIQQSVQLVEKTGMKDFKVPRNLRQLREASKRQVEKLGATARVTPMETAQANALLAARGYNVEKPMRTLNALSKIQMRAKVEPREQLRPTDLKGYLEHQYHLIALHAIEEASRKTTENFDSSYRQAVFREWKEKKRQLMEDELGHQSLNWKPSAVAATNTDASAPTTPIPAAFHAMHTPNPRAVAAAAAAAGAAAPGTPTAGTPSKRAAVSATINAKMQAYYRVVSDLNEQRLQAGAAVTLGVCEAFRNVAKTLDDGNSKQKNVIDECWALLQEYTEKPSLVPERSFYNNLQPKKFIEDARRFLEHQMKAHVLSTISQRQNLESVHIGGDPDPVNNIKAYVSLKGFTSIWALIYYLVRCGETEVALRECRAHRSETGKFGDYLAQFIHDRSKMPEKMLKDIRHEYAQLTQYGSEFIFKVALYKIVGCCDVRKSLTEVFSTTPDFMWLKLTLIRDGGEYTLSDLKANLARFGPAHFNPKGSNPLLYFQVLLLSQQFEKAVHYLLVNEDFRIEGVHFAIALYHYGLLHQPDPKSKGYSFLFFDPSAAATDGPGTPQAPATPLLAGRFSIGDASPIHGRGQGRASIGGGTPILARGGSSGEQPTINMAKLMQKYSHSFEVIDVAMALHYLFVLQTGTEAEYHTKTKCIQDLVLRTRSFKVFEEPLSQMLGDREQVRDMQREAAMYSYRNGSVDDAIHLCDLAQDYDSALSILSSEMSRTLTIRGEERNKAFERMQQYMQTRGGNIDPSTRSFYTYRLLYKLFAFFEYYWDGPHSESLREITETELLPLGNFDEREMYRQITAKVAQARGLDSIVLRNFADILVCTMDILYHEFIALKASTLADKAQRMRYYRMQAKGLLTFAGMLEYQLPATALARLSTTEAAMI